MQTQVGKELKAIFDADRLRTAPTNTPKIGRSRHHSGKLPYLSARLQFPRVVRRVGTSEDAEVTGIEHHARGAVPVKHQEILEFDLVQGARYRPKSLAGGCQPHLDISRSRKDGGVADPMIDKIAQSCRIELYLPGRLRSLEPGSQQWMNAIAGARPACPLGFPPMSFRLERV